MEKKTKFCCRPMIAIVVLTLATTEYPARVRAVNCNPMELSPCVEAMTLAAAGEATVPPVMCCRKLREQRPCMCGFINDPNLRQFIGSPVAMAVAASCGRPHPHS
ncbi:PREDICTED: non-specific lipid-transfer protein 2-like [Tarenaya hassleriana]|uniref:non-specific lipid-transfer protein 2-like n=1 Tax=Tarenaya hassleriana TaxID=28532 RepID=UPI00053C37A3|nr:PREDICTED: non-specific lipid-transfer protein 2-like [Tarenaya hassleriana]